MDFISFLVFIIFGIVVAILVKCLQIMAIYNDLSDFRKYFSTEAIAIEGTLTEVKYEVKSLKLLLIEERKEAPKEPLVIISSSPQEIPETSH